MIQKYKYQQLSKNKQKPATEIPFCQCDNKRKWSTLCTKEQT